ncbi:MULTISPECIES: DNA double-strand break repair nuclease NurA [unclassified Methanobrevibacter]|uniref:DNA double-strand break repair nuclease NurA n=1 Tax=unclassified Methanobrevibacter TaxID=2638681 RepID=UPI0039B85397
MSYSEGLKPAEFASQSSQTPLILDEDIKELLKDCYYPKHATEELIGNMNTYTAKTIKKNPIRKVLAFDGGYNEVMIGKEFPSSTVAFYRYGVNYFQLNDLFKLEDKEFIGKLDIGKLHNIDAYNFSIPTKNIKSKTQKNLKNSIRYFLYNHFKKTKIQKTLMETLSWFIYREYRKPEKMTYLLSSCPKCGKPVILYKHNMKNYTFNCPHCHEKIYLTDVFRLHELISENLAKGISSYLMNTLEQFLIIHYIHILMDVAPSLLKESLFIKDGPLAFFGVTSNMSKPMRELITYLEHTYDLFLVGVEKSGEFVDHAHEVSQLLEPGTYIIPDNEYIYKYIIFGEENINQPYGSTTYYSNKIIYKSTKNKVFVLDIPSSHRLSKPCKNDFKNIDIILNNLDKLKNDRFDNALLPISLINQNVSISQSVSGNILKHHAETSLS